MEEVSNCSHHNFFLLWWFSIPFSLILYLMCVSNWHREPPHSVHIHGIPVDYCMSCCHLTWSCTNLRIYFLIASPLKARVCVCVCGICSNVTFQLGLVGIRYAPRVPNSVNYNGKRSTVDCRFSHCYVSLTCCALIHPALSSPNASVYAKKTVRIQTRN